MADGPELKIDIAEKRFPVLPAPLYVDLDIDVPGGQVLALVGPSGIGKSSLLRLVAGIDTDYVGTITIGGVSAEAAPPPGFVFQDSRLLPWLTAIDNITAVNPAITRPQGEAMLERVGLQGFADAYPHQLSGGMQRRVALARAFSVNSRLLLLDEPFVSLDRHLVAGLQKVLLGLMASERPTAILVTHLPEDAALLADRAIVLDGRPARVVADIAFESRRGERDPQELLRLTQLLSTYSEEKAL
ncbi:ABC transporter ATP-binding protein [Paradevosia shaoguanensis]|uniref:ABC transporter ATP-binding protein n=1 Tax=Paradevosia shaoguanensis TaxID=1335043 RepID=UPI0019340FB2|nr:ATP-binding cassette domain-containing protein [Paradevosia shaoguanensis]